MELIFDLKAASSLAPPAGPLCPPVRWPVVDPALAAVH